MQEQNIFKQIDTELNEFRTHSIQIVSNFKFNQKKTIEQIFRYHNSVFESGEFDSEGDKKYFYNIVRNPCYIATKAIDFDKKDIILLPAPGQNSTKVWLMDRDLKYWMKKKQFGRILNEIFFRMPIFGSVVLKKVQGNLYFVDLRNLVNEQTADSLQDSAYVIELHYYSPEELRKKKWQNIEETIKMWRETKAPYIRIIERYGEVPETWIREQGDPKKYVYSRFIVYSRETKTLGAEYTRRYEIGTAGYVLDKEEISKEDFPYREFHWEKIPGRWLGIGRVEILFDNQIRINQIVNQQAKSGYFASLNVFQTSDETINKNLLTDVKQGQILHVRAPVSRVPTEERNLSAFENEKTRWLQNRDEMTMAYDVIRGERLPAGTPLGSAILAAQMTVSYFDQIRENVALAIKELLYKDIIPQFLKENNKEHYLKLVGEDFDKWQKLEIAYEATRELFRFLVREKKLPTLFQYELMKARIVEKRKNRKEIELPIDARWYEDVKYDVDIVITGESRDIRTRAANLQMALQAITVDPTLLENPIKRKIFAKILEQGGIYLEDIEAVEREPETLPQILEKRITPQLLRGAGGGVSRPVLPNVPEFAPQETRV